MAFLKPQLAAAPVAAPKKGKSTGVAEQAPGYAEVAALDACAKAIDALLTLKKAEVTLTVTARLSEIGLTLKKKPDSLKIAEGQAAGSCYFRQRSTMSPLSQDELDLLGSLLEATTAEDGTTIAVPGFTDVATTRPEMLALNPAYAGDEVLLKRIDKALSGVAGIPDDFIVLFPAETKTVVAENALDLLFQQDKETVEALLPTLAGVTLKPVFSDLDAAWAIVKPLLGDVPEVEPKKRRAA